MFGKRNSDQNMISGLLGVFINKISTLVYIFLIGTASLFYNEYRKSGSFVQVQTDKLMEFGQKIFSSKIYAGSQNAKNCITNANKNSHPRDVVECIVVEK